MPRSKTRTARVQKGPAAKRRVPGNVTTTEPSIQRVSCAPGSFRAWLDSLPPPPSSYSLGQDLAWDAPWIDVTLSVELPFWLLVDNTTLPVNLGGHEFEMSLHGELFELQIGQISDAKQSAVYRGPFKQREKLSADIRRLLSKRPKPTAQWRKCKTVLRIRSRCNEDVWKKRISGDKPWGPSVNLYLVELCRAHIPIVNGLIRGYRLATYDRFAFEVAPWDVPFWYVERGGQSALVGVVPYRGWDHMPMILGGQDSRPRFYRLIKPDRLSESVAASATPGELELLGAINFMERGNYSDAVRRVTTAIEVIVEAVTVHLLEQQQGQTATAKFLKNTRADFPRRLAKYEELSARALPKSLEEQLLKTRMLRHRIVHGGYRITPAERNEIQRCIDMGRWTFNWFENNPARSKVREQRIASRSIGREMAYGIFRAEITPAGMVVRSCLTSDEPKETPAVTD
jgi:hypothetical protein